LETLKSVQEVSKQVIARQSPTICKLLIMKRAGNRNRTGDLLITSLKVDLFFTVLKK
jgi:hypothetical protein